MPMVIVLSLSLGRRLGEPKCLVNAAETGQMKSAQNHISGNAGYQGLARRRA
jgi:hypothetical protein